MLYAIFCYDSEQEVCAWSAEQDAAVMASLGAVLEKLSAQGRLGPVARLAPTTKARTIRKGKDAMTEGSRSSSPAAKRGRASLARGNPRGMILDGPFAETKEQLLGFYVVACATPEEALEVATELARASGSAGAFEVRPITLFRPGGAVA